MRSGQILSTLAGVAILIALVAHFGLADLAATLGRADAATLALYLCLSWFILVMYSFRWQRIAAALSVGAPLRRFLVMRVVADGISSLIPPGRVAGDALRIGLLVGDGAPGASAGASVMLDRFCEAIGNMMIAMTYIVLIILHSSGHAAGLQATGMTLALLLLALLIVVALLYFGFTPLSPPVARLSRRLPRLHPLLDTLMRVEQQLHHTLRERPAVFLKGVGLSLTIEIFIALQYRTLLHAFAIDVTLTQLAMVILGSGLARAAPAPAALGALEASQIALLGTLGVAPQAGFVIGAVLRLHETFWLAMAALFGLSNGVRWPRVSQATQQA